MAYMFGLHFRRPCPYAAVVGLLIAQAPVAAQNIPEAPAPPSRQAAFVEVLEPGGQVRLTVRIAEDGTASRSVRLRLAASGNPQGLSLLPSDLVSDRADRIDRSNVRIVGQAALSPLPQDWKLEIAGLRKAGRYQGNIEVRSRSAAGLQTIPITIDASLPDPVELAPETPRLVLKLAESCGQLTHWMLGSRACDDDFRLNLRGNVAEPAKVRIALSLIGPDGSALAPGGPVRVTMAENQLVLSLPQGSLPPGHYSGSIRARFADDSLVQAPIEIDVRWAALWPLLFILLGVLAGRLQAYMAAKGNAVAAIVQRLDWVRARSAQLRQEYRADLDWALKRVKSRVDARQLEEAKAEIEPLETGLSALEDLEILASSPPPLPEQEVSAVREAVRLNDGAGARRLVDALKASRPGGAALADPEPAEAEAGGSGTRLLGSLGTILTVWARPLLWLALVILVSLAGLFTLYVSEGAHMGSAPLANFLVLFAWGLTADVAGRTLASFRGAASS